MRPRNILCLPLCACMLAACGERPLPGAIQGDPARGRAAIERYGCAACHTIPGVPSYGANVGPPLTELGSRAYLAGVLPHTPANLVLWLRDPARVAPRTMMPALGMTEEEATDMAAYLSTLR